MEPPVLPPLRTVSRPFTADDLCGGHVVLDFVNTAAGLNRDPRDWLDGYPRLVEWARLAGLCEEGEARALLAGERDDPTAGIGALRRARTLRAALYRLLHSHRARLPLPAAALGELQRWVRRGGAALTLAPRDDGTLDAAPAGCGLDRIAAAIALAALDLLSQPLDGGLGVCAGRNCGWLFLDRSRSRRRRWCDMRTCGNAAKASRHYHRERNGAEQGRGGTGDDRR